MSRATASGTRSGKPIGRPRIGLETEADIRAVLKQGDIGMRKSRCSSTGTVQRIAKGLGPSVAA